MRINYQQRLGNNTDLGTLKTAVSKDLLQKLGLDPAFFGNVYEIACA